MAKYTVSDVFRIVETWFQEGVDPYWSIDRLAGGRIVYKAVLIEHGKRVQAEGKSLAEATLKAMMELRGYVE